jgi:hypothetical protein
MSLTLDVGFRPEQQYSAVAEKEKAVFMWSSGDRYPRFSTAIAGPHLIKDAIGLCPVTH